MDIILITTGLITFSLVISNFIFIIRDKEVRFLNKQELKTFIFLIPVYLIATIMIVGYFFK